jgi:hypothetical protein
VPGIEDHIREIEEEILRTKYNKATSRHIGGLKAKIARLREKQATGGRTGKGGSGEGFAVRKTGHASIGLVGFPSVGKSTLLNRLTGIDSKVGAYDFTTLDVVPGLMRHGGAEIQVLDMPGLIEGAARGRGRGKEVLAVVRSLDMALVILDVIFPDPRVLIDELASAGIRVNKRRPDVKIVKKERGGIEVTSTLKLSKIDEDVIKAIMKEYRISNAHVVVRTDIDMDEFIDVLDGNRIYIRGLIALNKIDLVSASDVKEMIRKLAPWKVFPISAGTGEGIDAVKQGVFDAMEFMRVFLKPPGKKADLVEPLIVKGGSTIEHVCNAIHRDWASRFRYAQVWGKSADHPGQRVGLEHELSDEDILSVHLRTV